MRGATSILKSMLDQSAVGRVFHALGDPTRRAIVDQLCRAPKSAKDLAAPLQITLAAVVQHLQMLEESGVIRTKKVGRVRVCRIEPAGLQVAQRWIATRQSSWERRLDRLGAVLAAERE
jgi:DNA-binding transcriptional ArsR family regulator